MNTHMSQKRSGQRIKLETVVGLKFDEDLNMAYTIDVSRGGMKVGRPQLYLTVGTSVEIVIDKQGKKYPFPGRVVRVDGSYFITRLNRSADAYFIEIRDEQFSDFVANQYFI